MKEYVHFEDQDTGSIAEATLIPAKGFVPDVKTPAYFFNRLVSKKPGNGGGTIVLKKMLAYIDEVGIPLLNYVSAYGNLSQTELEAYYKMYGFVQVNKKFGDALLIYYPKGKNMREMIEELQEVFEMLKAK